MNSNTIESLSTSLQDRDCVTACTNGGLTKSSSNISNSSQTLDKTDKNGKLSGLYSLQEEQSACMAANVEHRKYDIGQLSSLNSPSNEENEDLELFNKITQLQNELDSKTKANLECLNGAAGGSSKKQRPKSELIAGLTSTLDEYIDDMWDLENDTKYSAEQLKSYYSISFSSPYSQPEQSRAVPGASGHLFGGNKSAVKIRNRVLGSNGKPRPKTIHASYSETGDFSEMLKTPISYFDSDLNEINELESFNDEPFVREETMIVMNGNDRQSPMKSDEESVSNAPTKISNLSNSNSNGGRERREVRARTTVNQTANKISPTKNGTVNPPNSNTTTICSPMSTSSMMCSSSISQSLSQSSGYQSFMEDSVFDNHPNAGANQESNSENPAGQARSHPHATNGHQSLVNHQALVNHHQASVNHASVNHTHLNGDKSCQIKLRNQPNQLRLNNPNSKRYSCNIPNFGNSYESTQTNANQENSERSPNDPKNPDGQLTVKSQSNNFGQSVGKQIPNSSSNVEISLNGNSKVETWERKMMKTYSTNAFNGKDTIYSNSKNVQRTGSNSFLNLSDLIRKRKDKKKKKEYQFCMLVFGGNEKSNGNQAVQFSKQPIAVWKLYI